MTHTWDGLHEQAARAVEVLRQPEVEFRSVMATPQGHSLRTCCKWSFCICMYVCISVCLCVFVCMHKSMSVSAYVCLYVCVFVYLCLYLCVLYIEQKLLVLGPYVIGVEGCIHVCVGVRCLYVIVCVCVSRYHHMLFSPKMAPFTYPSP